MCSWLKVHGDERFRILVEGLLESYAHKMKLHDLEVKLNQELSWSAERMQELKHNLTTTKIEAEAEMRARLAEERNKAALHLEQLRVPVDRLARVPRELQRGRRVGVFYPLTVLGVHARRGSRRAEPRLRDRDVGHDGLRHLVSLVGPSWARLIMYTGMRIDSAEALRIGLVDRVLPDAELWDATMEIARTISGNAPLAIKAAKITIAQVLKDPAERDMAAIKQIGIDCMDSSDFREGRNAFMEKRKPQFKGR